MDVEGTMLSKLQGERQILFDFPHMQNIKKKNNKKLNKPNKNKHIDLESRVVDYQWDGDWG